MADNLKCQFCGREVKPTVHSKKLPQGYKVDYYLVWTGELEPVIINNPKDEREMSQFYKVEKLHAVVACTDCYQKQEVQDEMESQFKKVPTEKSALADEEADDK
jgi:hypothetical protein